MSGSSCLESLSGLVFCKICFFPKLIKKHYSALLQLPLSPTHTHNITPSIHKILSSSIELWLPAFRQWSTSGASQRLRVLTHTWTLFSTCTIRGPLEWAKTIPRTQLNTRGNGALSPCFLLLFQALNQKNERIAKSCMCELHSQENPINMKLSTQAKRRVIS